MNFHQKLHQRQAYNRLNGSIGMASGPLAQGELHIPGSAKMFHRKIENAEWMKRLVETDPPG
jgi:hypothetical protein